VNAENLVGQQVDRYRILKHIARGGMADVYLAEDVDLKRKVAFKVMLAALSTDPQFSARFQREAQTVAKLEHPNIVQVYRTGLMPSQAAGIQQPYLVMQYIAGGSLRDKLQELADRKKLLKTGQALAITRQIAQALAVAHRANIVHRDLKPSNVLIRPDGTPVLVDLGIAAVGSDAKLTRTGLIMGTPHYMSPEQVRSKAVDGRSDLYALGIILYEMLAGIRPFEADESIAVLHKQVYEKPPSVRKFRQNIAPQTVQIVGTALKKAPSQRYQHAENMIAAIDTALKVEGGMGQNIQTAVLRQLDDTALVSRTQLVRTPAKPRTKPQTKPRTKPQTKPKLVAETPSQPRRAVPVWMMAAGGVLLTAVFLFFLLRAFNDGTGNDTAIITPSVTNTVEVVAVIVTTVVETAVFTPTPTPTDTPTPLPTPIPSQIGYYINDTDQYPFTLADRINSNDAYVQLHINNDTSTLAQDAYIFAQPYAEIEFENITSNSTADSGLRFILYEGSDIFLDTGSYENGADISPIEDTRISFLVSGSCMSLQYDAETSIMDVGCYEGDCGYRAQERDEITPLAEGYLLRYDILAQTVIETRLIRTSEGRAYKNILLQSEAGRTVHDHCVLPLFPVSVATPIAAATNTEVPTQPPSPVATTPPQPNATNTPVSPTNTPEPPTLEPPIDTPEPPTPKPPIDTPEPPTPEPPTATPEPPTPEPPTATPFLPAFPTATVLPLPGPPTATVPPLADIATSKPYLPLLAIPMLWIGLGVTLVSSYTPRKSDELSEK